MHAVLSRAARDSARRVREKRGNERRRERRGEYVWMLVSAWLRVESYHLLKSHLEQVANKRREATRTPAQMIAVASEAEEAATLKQVHLESRIDIPHACKRTRLHTPPMTGRPTHTSSQRRSTLCCVNAG